jgi:DNA gyrase subunit A
MGIELSATEAPADQSPGMDEVVSMIVIPHGNLEACMVLTACENGFGKRTPVDEYRLIKRGGKGVINIKTTERNGNVVGMKAVCDVDELMLITEKGILMRTRVSEIRETGRNAQGVRLIRVDEGDRLVAMARVDAEEKVEGAEGTATTPPAGSEGSEAPGSGEGEAPPEDTGGNPALPDES